MIDPTSYDNADFIPDGPDFFDRWARQAANFRNVHPESHQRLDQQYGNGARERFDFFLPTADGQPRGLFVFLHGGFWRMGGRKDWSHVAAGALGNGWAVAIPSYPLAPDVHVSGVTAAIARSLPVMAATVDGPILVSGHSAGGHLALRMACPDVELADAVRSRIAGILAISPLADLNPLLMLPMNEFLRIDAAEADSESPIRYPEPVCKVLVEVGAAERRAFIDQSLRLADDWPKTELTVSNGYHHFDVMDPLTDPQSEMVRRLLSMAD